MYCNNCSERLPNTIRICPKCGSKKFSDATNLAGAINQTLNVPQNAQPTGFPNTVSIAPARSASSMEYASFWRRLIAYIIDTLIFIPLSIILLIFDLNEDLITIVVGLVFLIYMAVLNQSKRQATLGKRVMGLWVFDANGQRLSFGRAFVRSLLFFWLYFLFFTMFFSEKKQTVHDMLAKTVVLYSPE